MKFEFWRPPQKKILIYDYHHSEFLKDKFFSNSLSEIEILYTRFEKMNLYILFKSLLKLKPFKLISYFQEYVNCVSPKIIITMTDNDAKFYQIKCESGKKIFIQNGRRTLLGDIFSVKKKKLHFKYHVDKMFVHNSLVGEKYKKFISGNYCSIGSVMSNFRKVRSSYIVKNKLIYVSAFRTGYLSDKDKVYKDYKWSTYIEGEIKFLKLLNIMLLKNNFKLVILAKYGDQRFVHEKNFFLNYFNKNKVEIVKNFKNRNNFKIIDDASLIIGNDSTLCYEAFGRGKKVYFFGLRGKDKILKSRNFAYPLVTLNKGIFWDNTLNFHKIDRCIKKLIKMPAREWNKYHYRYKDKVMNYDYNNMKIKKYFNEN